MILSQIFGTSLHLIMKKQKPQIILVVNNLHSNFIPATGQTQFIRDRTNKKIKELGDKYYNIKSLFDSLGLQRDALFGLARKLEIKYKDIKPGIHIETRDKRMKDAVYTWFADNFYTEIFSNDARIIEELFAIRKVPKSSSSIKPPKCQKKKPTKRIAKTAKLIENSNLNQDDIINSSITNDNHEPFQGPNIYISFTKLKVNEEIDELDNSNNNNDDISSKDSLNCNPNFNLDLIKF